MTKVWIALLIWLTEQKNQQQPFIKILVLKKIIRGSMTLHSENYHSLEEKIGQHVQRN